VPLSRDTIIQAVVDRLVQKVTLCKRFERKELTYDQIEAGTQPALMCVEGPELANDGDPNRAPDWVISLMLIVHARTEDTPKPGKILNDILDQIEGAFELAKGEAGGLDRYFTNLGLGPMVQYVRIAGEVQKEPGPEGGQGQLGVPVHVHVVTQRGLLP
jgi:hypothetical protein